MILKIERYTEQDWWMLDDIRKISKRQFKQEFNKDFETGQADIFILDYIEYVNSTNIEQNSRIVIELICRLSNDTEFNILFDTVAYLCNDEGKTIEKIVANYKD